MRAASIAVFLLVVANGMFADIAYGLQAGSGALPASPVLLVIALAGAMSIARSPSPGRAWGLASSVMLSAAALVPSSLAAWWVLLVVSAIGLAADRGRRAAHQIPLALAATQIWKAMAFKVVAGPIVEAEARLLGGLLGVLKFDVEVVGNVVRLGPEHALVILAGCSAFSDLGIVLLGWLAMFRLANPNQELPICQIVGVGAGVVGLNIARLMLMSLSPSWHAWMHDGTGAALHDAIVCAMLVSAVGTQRTIHRHRPGLAAAPA